MKKKYYFVILFLLLTMFFIINTSSVNANMYKILDSEGNIIRITNNPVLSNKEIEAGCKILSAPEGIIMPTQDQITNGQEIKQEISSGNEKYDFRKTNWGMSKEQVKATEDKNPDLEYDNILSYKVKIGEDNFVCFYYFLEDKIYKAFYSLDEEHLINKNDYINDFARHRKALIKQYGETKIDKIIWKNDLLKDKEQYWGVAVGRGDLVCTAEWETPTTKIDLELFGVNYKILLTIGYESKELKEWADKIKEKRTVNDLIK